MCGIAGLVLTGEQRPQGLDPQNLIQRMIERLRHRGPESIRIKRFSNNACWLAHARLGGTDGQVIADQPFPSESGRWTIVLDGEIYNWQDLDGYLRPTGWEPQTDSDTERLAEMVERVGVECLHSLDGMFAFGAYDKKTENLFLARDRFGQKPLYYVTGNGIVAFSSELSALMELSPWIPMQISLNGMSQFFRLHYVPAPATAVEPIRKLEPGQYAVINRKGKLLLDRFFTPSKEGTLCSNDLERSAVQKLQENPKGVINSLLKESIQKTVPQNAAIVMSGGTDSTLIAAYTAQLDQKMGWSPSNRRGYTVQLKHQPQAEAQWAQSLCKKWGWEHELISLNDRHLINAYSRVIERLDEPLGDQSLLPSWSLAQVIQPHQRAAINGIGGDELFLGYSRYLGIAPELKKARGGQNWANLYWQHAFSTGDNNAIEHADHTLGLNPMQLLCDQMKVLQAEYEHSPLEFLQVLDLLNYLPGCVLATTDRSGMDWGLETRSPLLNTRVALAALALKPEHLIKGRELKTVLRQLLRAKAAEPPRGAKQGIGAAIRQGSELETYLKQKIQKNLRTLVDSDKGAKSIQWLTQFKENTIQWNHNSLFCFSIWTDWQAKTKKNFSAIKF